MNSQQSVLLRWWLVVLVVLGLFPPFETVTKLGAQYPFETSTRHGFVLLNEKSTVGEGLGTYFKTTTINIPALSCELLAVTAFAAFIFICLVKKKV
jgi:hypothetical protein